MEQSRKGIDAQVGACPRELCPEPEIACLDDAQLQKLLESALDPRELALIDAHIDACERCWLLVADMMRARSVEFRGSHSAEIGIKSPLSLPDVGRRYLLLDLIGMGGMGRVYRAQDRLTGQTVALKCVRFGTTGSASSVRPLRLARQALAQEFRTLATLRHPNIISVLDYGFDAAGRPYFTMELLEQAEPLSAFAASLQRDAVIGLLVELLRALCYLHRRGILHCDIKPSNLLVASGADGPTLKVLDFGLSLTREPEGVEASPWGAAGTLRYMAPELLRGDPSSEASDLYAAGVVAYELLVGHHPLRAHAAAADILAEVRDIEPDLAPLPPALRPVIGRALSKSPEGRPRDAATFLRELSVVAGVALESDPPPARDSFLVAARFIGREKELRELRGALDAARRGHGSAWLVGGESGVGKSRLLDELRSSALVGGVIAARGQALPSGGTAYHVFRSALELLALYVDLSDEEASVLGAILPNLPALLERDVAPPPELDVQNARARLLAVMRSMVERTKRIAPADGAPSGSAAMLPLLVLLEDLHWADEESLVLLSQLSAVAGELPLLIVASYRDDEAPRIPQKLPAMRAMHLSRLERPDIERLCESMLGPAGRDGRLIELVARETEGNTYFIVEAIRALAEESGSLAFIGRSNLPERILAGGIEQVFARRLARVPSDARPLLCLSAVAGRAIDIDLLSTFWPRPEPLIQACAEAGVLEMHEQRWRFSHDRLRERTVRDLGAEERRDLHARIAEGLESTYPRSAEHAAPIAYHYREADRLAKAAHFYGMAGEAALARGAPSEAEAMLEQARSIYDMSPASRISRMRVWRGLAQARFGLGRLAGTDAAIREVCALAGTPLPTTGLGTLRMTGRKLVEHMARRAGLDRYFPLDPKGEMERAMAEELVLAMSVLEVYVWLARPELFLMCALWGANLEETVCTRHRTNFRTVLAYLLSYTPLRGLGMKYMAEVAATTPPGTPSESNYLRVRASMWLNGGHLEKAKESAVQAVACARAIRADLALMEALLQLELAAFGLGEFRHVLAICDEMEELAARSQHARYAMMAATGKGIALHRLGRIQEAKAVIDRAVGDRPPEPGPVPEATLLGVAALCALQRGEGERAEVLAVATMAAIDRARWTMLELRYALACILEVHLGVGSDGMSPGPSGLCPRSPGNYRRRFPEARRALEKSHRIAHQFPFAETDAWRYQGRYEALRGRPARAVECLRRAIRAGARDRSRLEVAWAHYWLGQVARSEKGRPHVPEGATMHFRASLEIFEDLDVPFEAAHAREALAGEPPARVDYA